MIRGNKIQVVILYLSLSLIDYWFTIIAARYSVAEASPIFSWAISHHIFLLIKMILVFFASTLIYCLYNKSRWMPWAAWSAIYLMTVVVIYQIYGLCFFAYWYRVN